MDICIGLRKQLATANLDKLQILNKLKHRIQDFIPELRKQFDKVGWLVGLMFICLYRIFFKIIVLTILTYFP